MAIIKLIDSSSIELVQVLAIQLESTTTPSATYITTTGNNMTVGTKPDVVEEEPQIPFGQIKEVTGITDKITITNAWKNCASRRGTVEEITNEVIASLLGPALPTSLHGQQDTVTEKPFASLAAPMPRARSNSMETNPETATSEQVVGEGDIDDIQKAIAASLAGQGPVPSMLGGQITREDQDISRVLEASLADNKSVDGKKNTLWFFDHANPYERRREDSWPVGLKNVGNTCWFNAVIQSLFHIESFRDLVTDYTPTDTLQKDHHIAIFMVELKRLFSLMLASDRKYLNPSAVIEILKQSFSLGGTGQSMHASNDQQDVSEFQHKLLEWLEEAFQHKAGNTEPEEMETESQAEGSSSKPQAMDTGTDASSQEKDESNDMVKLFYGKVKAYGSNAGEAFTTHTQFGQWPLYVAGFSDIHQSLEAGLAKGDIETNNTEQASTQEQWFTRLPPLLTFELSRFSYNTMQSQAEKLHNKFSFSRTLFLDRYLEENKEEVSEKRSKLWRLQSELSSLEAKLQKYTEYGSGGTDRYPLHNVLTYALEFATSGSADAPHAECPIHSLPPSTSSNAPTECICSSQPRPNTISPEELTVLTSCLARWKEEVRTTIAQYERDKSDLKQAISEAYDHNHLKQVTIFSQRACGQIVLADGSSI